jgi:hypothetical protein
MTRQERVRTRGRHNKITMGVIAKGGNQAKARLRKGGLSPAARRMQRIRTRPFFTRCVAPPA